LYVAEGHQWRIETVAEWSWEAQVAGPPTTSPLRIRISDPYNYPDVV
jgi:hypothetical protein